MPRLCVVFLFAWLLQGCSSTNQLYLETLKLAFFPHSPSLTLTEIKQSKADLLKIEYGDRQPAFLGLVYIEGEQHKWVSADYAVLTIDHNKIVSTSGLPRDLQNTSAVSNNPLRDPAAVVSADWDYQIDVAGGEYGLPVNTSWRVQPQRKTEFFATEFTVIPVIEDVTIERRAPYWHHQESWQNVYWIEVNSKQVIYSEQVAMPDDDVMRMTYVSRIARLITPKAGDN